MLGEIVSHIANIVIIKEINKNNVHVNKKFAPVIECNYLFFSLSLFMKPSTSVPFGNNIIRFIYHSIIHSYHLNLHNISRA